MENPLPLIFLGQITYQNTFKDTLIFRSKNFQIQSPKKDYPRSHRDDGSLVKKVFVIWAFKYR